MAELDSVILSRMLTTLTLAFHIIFATIGVGVPVLISIAEWMGIRKNDPHYILLARRWTRGFVSPGHADVAARPSLFQTLRLVIGGLMIGDSCLLFRNSPSRPPVFPG